MNRKIVFLTACLFFSVLVSDISFVSAISNPANVYCNELGYEYETITESDGSQYGNCVFSVGVFCGAWEFLQGECGQEYSYCAENGYETITKTDGQNSFSRDYAVCTLNGKEIGSVTKLMNLDELLGATKNTNFNLPETNQNNLPEIESLPPSFDWRSQNEGNYMTSVKDQGICTGCWAFSPVGAVEAQYNIDSHNPNLDLDLSEQQLISCCSGCGGCTNGGFNWLALGYIKNSGLVRESCFPYAQYNNPWDIPCDLCDNYELKDITSYFSITSSLQNIKTAIVEKGPVSAAYAAEYADGYFDSEGIYRCSDDNSPRNHAIVVAGYDNAGEYWIIKNSWGTEWNPDEPGYPAGGYFKLGYGECNLGDAYYTETPIELEDINCGDVLTHGITLFYDLLNCEDGLIVGADGITIDCNGHTISGRGSENGHEGIAVFNWVSNITIKNCKIKNFRDGIAIINSYNNVIFNNEIFNSENGVFLHKPSHNLLKNNKIHNNEYGILLENNYFPWGDGINNTLTDNEIYSNIRGGLFSRVIQTSFQNNQIRDNSEYGIKFLYSDENSLLSNTICSNNYDVKCEFSSITQSTQNRITTMENSCGDIDYEPCAFCGENNYGFEGDAGSSYCSQVPIPDCANGGCWGLNNGEVYNGCWRGMCCGDDNGEFLKFHFDNGGSLLTKALTPPNPISFKGCCDLPTDCVDSTGACRDGIEKCERSGVDEDCDGAIDCSDSDCFNNPLCVPCENNGDCPTCFKCNQNTGFCVNKCDDIFCKNGSCHCGICVSGFESYVIKY